MTFLQIVNLLKTVSLSQPNVHTFRRDFLELNREDTEYSAVVLQDRDSVIDRISEQDWILYTFHLGYTDRLTDDEANRDDVISTGITVLTSIINSIRNSFSSELEVLTEDRIITFDQRFTAQCAGVYLVLGIRLPLSDCLDAAQTDIYDTFEAKITENGQYHFVPSGKPVDEIDITIDVPSGKKPEESLEENIYANGFYTYTPSEGSVFDEVTVNVAVPSSGKTEVSLNDEISENGTHSFIPEYGEVWNEVNMTIDVHPTSRLTRTITSNGTTSISGEWKDADITVAVPSDRKPETTFSVTPSSQQQVITPQPGYVFSSGVVSAVTSSVDSNIVSGNIRSGVSILGVEGTVEERKPETTFSVRPSTTSQTITPDPGYVFSSGVVSAVTSSIDRNIAPWNIREGVTILGVQGTVYPQSPTTTFSVTPTTTAQTITPPLDYLFSSGTVAAVTSSIDSNIIPENIRQGVTILGVRGTLLTPDHITSGTFNITRNGNYQYKAEGVYWNEADINVSVPNATIPKPANDEIYYVSYDGKIITPYNSSDFGANIVWNRVHSSGDYCVLKFDGNVTKTGFQSFYSKVGLKEIYLPDSVTVISQSSFSHTGLQRCIMRDTVTTISGYAFSGCFALISPFWISKGCTTICPEGGAGAAFADCTALITITIPSTVTEIGRVAFEGCVNLRDVIVQAETPPVLIASDGVYLQFDGCTSLQRIRVPSGSVNTYKSASGWRKWASIIIAYYE